MFSSALVVKWLGSVLGNLLVVQIAAVTLTWLAAAIIVLFGSDAKRAERALEVLRTIWSPRGKR